MELYTFINKETKEPIRFHKLDIDDDFGRKFYFTTKGCFPIWIVESLELAQNAFQKEVHAQYSVFYISPNTELINLDEYEIAHLKFV